MAKNFSNSMKDTKLIHKAQRPPYRYRPKSKQANTNTKNQTKPYLAFHIEITKKLNTEKILKAARE